MSQENVQANRNTTRHLELPASALPPTAPIATGPLDRSLPWVIEFRAVGTTVTLQTQVTDTMTLGRADAANGFKPEVDLTPCDAFARGVSRKHAKIFVREGRLMLQDLNSTNGTRLNEVMCAPQNEYRLRHGDEIALGRLRMQVSFAVIPAHSQPIPTTAPAATGKLPEGRGKTALIIEDDKDVGNVFKLALDMHGYKAVLASDARNAFSTITLNPPDVIIMDLLLPDMDGFDLVRFFRRQKETARIPILVVSGATAGYQMGKALEAGADIFLGKPVAVEELVRAVGVMTNRESVASK